METNASDPLVTDRSYALGSGGQSELDSITIRSGTIETQSQQYRLQVQFEELAVDPSDCSILAGDLTGILQRLDENENILLSTTFTISLSDDGPVITLADGTSSDLNVTPCLKR